MSTVLVFDTANSFYQAVAEKVVAVAQASRQQRGQFVWALSGGSTPQPLYHLLATSPYREQMPWAVTYIFWGDERCVPADSPESNYWLAWETLLSRVDIPAGNIHRVKGELDPAGAAADYAQQLAHFQAPWPHFDLILLGLGKDGHTASLFPGPLLPGEGQQPVIPVTAHYEDRPAGRITFTHLLFNAARHIFFLVRGADKAQAVQASLAPAGSEAQWPARRIQPLSPPIWFLTPPTIYYSP